MRHLWMIGLCFALGAVGCSDVKDSAIGPPSTKALDVHPEGWTDPAAEGFHGKSLAKAAYDMSGCRGCHGADYSGGIANSACTVCHQETPEGCSTCHGSAASPAPPADVAGSTATTARGVGAHQAHLNGGALSGAIACDICHQVPTALHVTGHVDSALPAEVQFSGLAAKNANAAWNGATCDNVYCHGSATPTWTKVGEGEAACGTCHGAPPPSPHPQVDDCSLCHGEVVDAAGAIVDKTLHINGQINVTFGHPDGFVNPTSTDFHGLAIRQAGWSMTYCQGCHGSDYAGTSASNNVSCLTCHPSTPEDCSTCHGDANSPAPPPSIDNHTSTDFASVGAHRSHLTEGIVGGPVDCAECHSVPTRFDDPGHIDSDLPAEVAFGALAKTGGLTPVWDGQTCSNTYCHGTATPTWTEVGKGEAACGTCHGFPPPLPHPPVQQCSLCHVQVVDANLQFVNKSLHINGQVDF